MLRLSDDHWERIREHFPEENIPDGRVGRKPIPSRRILEAVLWILNTDAQWHMLPQCYPNYKTVHRRFQNGCRSEVLREVMTDLANTLRDEGRLTNRNVLSMLPLPRPRAAAMRSARASMVKVWKSWRLSIAMVCPRRSARTRRTLMKLRW